jgi:hypothetical protein
MEIKTCRSKIKRARYLVIGQRIPDVFYTVGNSLLVLGAVGDPLYHGLRRDPPKFQQGVFKNPTSGDQIW